MPVGVEAARGQGGLGGPRLRLEPRPLSVGLGERGLGLPGFRLLALDVAGQRREVAAGGPHPTGHLQALGQARLGRFEPPRLGLGRRQLLLARGQGLGGRVLEVHRELAGDELGLAPGLDGLAVRDPLHVLVDAEVQERDQDLAPLLRLPLQERVELPLGQDHRAGEGVVVEADDLHDLGLDLLHPIRRGLPALPVAVLQPDLDRPVGPGGAGDAIAAAAHFELEQHREALGPVAHELAVFLANAGHLAVEGEDEGIDERRLAGARGARDREEVEAGEVERELLSEGGKPLDLELEGPHRRASARVIRGPLRRRPGTGPSARRRPRPRCAAGRTRRTAPPAAWKRCGRAAAGSACAGSRA